MSLVVGSGAAGLYSALCLPTELQIAIITKDTIKTGSSSWAQGGIAAAIAPDDSPQLHLEDTLKAGAGLCDQEAVSFLVENAANSIESLLKMGVAFDRYGNTLAMTREAAHSRSRVLHSADTTGKTIVNTLSAKVLHSSNIRILSQAFVLSLWLEDDTTHRIQGVSILYKNQIKWVKASSVILATGGGGQVYAHTTNPQVSTGDGVALAWRSGAIVRDLEFFQFHPTALTKKNAPHFLISEAVRGEGAHLVDNSGHRFAFDYHPDGELAPRDVVSRAIFNHLKTINSNATTYPKVANVYLDLRPIHAEQINYRFPNILKVCQNYNINPLKEPIPVAPAAHYWMGGVATDLRGKTSIPGLYAIGETASTGVHGANRLASNSLLECLVFAAQLSQIKIESNGFVAPPITSMVETRTWENEIEAVLTIRAYLPQLMWQSAGISRSQELLEKALEQVSFWRDKLTTSDICQYLQDLTPNKTVKLESANAQKQLTIVAETLNLVDISYLILKSAAWRTESRGGHYRQDYPDTSSDWQVHTLIQDNRIWQSSPLNYSLTDSAA